MSTALFAVTEERVHAHGQLSGVSMARGAHAPRGYHEQSRARVDEDGGRHRYRMTGDLFTEERGTSEHASLREYYV